MLPAACLPANTTPTKSANANNSSQQALVRRFLAAEQYIPLADIKPGAVGYGLTVFHGTTVERFNVRVIGIIKKVLNGRDAILVKMSGGALANNNVIRGMSGSPVYIDGKLAGAVSFGFDFSKEPLAGVTPIADMLDALVTEQSNVNRIAQRESQPWFVSGISKENVASSTPHLVPLVSPLALTGFSPGAETFLQDRLKPFGINVASGAAGAQDPSLKQGHQPEIRPGGAISVMLATGDFNVVATGTATARFGQKVLALGHPFLQAGAIDFPMATAYIHEVLPSLCVSFKLASPVQIVGAFTSDRPWSLGGQLGRTAHMIPATYTVTDRTRKLKRTYNCQVVDHSELTPDLLAGTAMSAIDSTHQSDGPYVATVESVIEADGIEPIKRTDMFSSNFSAHSASDSGRFHYLADPVGSFVLRTVSELVNNDFVKTSIKRITLNITLDDGHKTARLDKVFLDKQFVAPGESLQVHLLIKPYNGNPRLETMTLMVPLDMPDGQMIIGCASGDDIASVRKRLGIVDPTLDTLKQIRQRILDRGRGDTIELVASLPKQSFIINGTKLSDPPAHWAHLFTSNRSTKGPAVVKSSIRLFQTTDWLIDGSHILSIEVRNPEKALARQAPPEISLPNPDESITITSEAKKALEATKKSSVSSPGSQPTSSAETAEKPAVNPTVVAGTLKDYPHMRPAKIWRQESEEEFRSGKTNNTAVDSWGRLGPGCKDVADKALQSEQRIWSAVCSGGHLWFATADKLWRWSGDHTEPEKVAEFDSVVVPALACDSTGTVFAATAPDGQIWACSNSDAPRKIAKLAEPIITSLCFDNKDNLYAGVCGTGKIYKIDQSGTVTSFFTSSQTHILSLSFSTYDSKIYAGCGDKAVVYAIDLQGRAQAVYQAPDRLATGACRDRTGNLYVATAAQGHLYRITPSGAVQPLASSEAFYKLHYSPSADLVFAGDGEGDITICKEDPTSHQPYFFPLCHTEQEEVLALASDSAGHLYAGTANLASVRSFALAESTDASYESAVRDAEQPASWIALRSWGALNEPLAGLADKLTVSTRTGNSARPDLSWSDWHAAPYQDGSFAITSAPARYLQYRINWLKQPDLPAVEPVKLGRVEVSYLPHNSAPTFTNISLKEDQPLSGKQDITITGSDPDSDNLLLNIDISEDGGKSWKLLSKAIRSKSKAPELSATNKSKKKRQPDISAPEPSVNEKKHKDDSSTEPLKGSVQQDESGKTQGADQQLPSSSNSKAPDKTPSVNLQLPCEGQADNEKKQEPKVSHVRIKELKQLLPAGSNLPDKGTSSEAAGAQEKLTYSFDTTKYKDGDYLVKLTLDDRLSNPEDHLDAVTVRSITVSNKPPVLDSFTFTRAGSISFTVLVKSSYATVANATYRLDDGEPYALAGVTHLAAGTSGQLGVSNLTAGAHKVEIKVTDKAGNSTTKTFNLK